MINKDSFGNEKSQIPNEYPDQARTQVAIKTEKVIFRYCKKNGTLISSKEQRKRITRQVKLQHKQTTPADF